MKRLVFCFLLAMATIFLVATIIANVARAEEIPFEGEINPNIIEDVYEAKGIYPFYNGTVIVYYCRLKKGVDNLPPAMLYATSYGKLNLYHYIDRDLNVRGYILDKMINKFVAIKMTDAEKESIKNDLLKLLGITGV